MKPTDLAIVNDLFACVAPVAAAEMKGRVLAELRRFIPMCHSSCDDLLNDAIDRIEALPLSKETTT